ncbi:hypothetical protein SAMD00079811_23460 [Scytonema sp. HK-05]|uniref:FUSC family protein n=1 Tax=Scytonema sp. HK-05 TaxID=1137095 RepID=UPI0009358CE5|nr:FUSC family protein [Scytonema sp. HK-05]OKH60456.1 hypothetical protein NIES2130_03410 [Scytonema sp. HK-05]BAY44744.1 hypothetical protein SAMD00079811_23460 [Scytonema sp. HK-05]
MLQSSLHRIWVKLKLLPWNQALRYTVEISVPLIAGVAVGQIRYGVVALIGSVYVGLVANVDGSFRDRLLATVTGAILITGCAYLGGLFANLPIVVDLGVLLLGVAAGWLHTSHKAIEVMCRFAVVGFLFGASQLSAFGTKLIDLDHRAAVAFLAGGIWTILVVAIENLLCRKPPIVESKLYEGWVRIRARQTAGLRFGLCYGVVAAIAFTGSGLLGLPRPFWVAVTTLMVMQPDSRATVRRTLQRLFGTLIGVLVVGGIIHLTQNPWLLTACSIMAAPFVPIGLARNYTVCCVATTVLVMVVIDLLTLTHGGDLVLLPVRFYATAVGCLLTVISTAIAYPQLWWRN